MFELTLTKSQLLSPLLTVANAVDKKNALPVLSNILMTLLGNELLLTATDLEIEITARITCQESTKIEDKTTVPAKKFVDIIRSLDEDAMPRLRLARETIVIHANRSQFKLATLPADEFPSSEHETYDITLNMPRMVLIHLLQATHFAIAQQEVRHFLNGLLLEFEEKTITAVATDGHRMAICKWHGEAAVANHRFLLPKKGVQEMLRVLTAIEDETICVAGGKGSFKIETVQYHFQCKLIEARFPLYQKAIPRAQDKFVLVEREALKRSLSRMLILANERSKAVLLHMQPGSLTLIANNQEQEEATETLEATTDGDALKIAINASYLLDVLAYLQEGLVRLSFASTESSILVDSTQDEGYQYIIMPMKL